MSFRLVLLKSAEEDTSASMLWYKVRDPLLAERFLAAVSECYERILSAPRTWPIVRGRIRSVRTRKFPFRIYYEVIGEEILVLRVYHMKRDDRKRFPKRSA